MPSGADFFFAKKTKKSLTGRKKWFRFFPMKYVIAHWTKTSFLGKSGWTNKSFARRFDSFEDAEEFCAMCGLDEEGVWIEAV